VSLLGKREDRHLLERAGMLRGSKWRKRWSIAIPLYDVRECPECGALVKGNDGQHRHWIYHNGQREWRAIVNDNFQVMADALEIETQSENQTDMESDDKEDEKETTGYVL
jgi:hypothetical protein